jgi:hypothetical protein
LLHRLNDLLSGARRLRGVPSAVSRRCVALRPRRPPERNTRPAVSPRSQATPRPRRAPSWLESRQGLGTAIPQSSRTTKTRFNSGQRGPCSPPPARAARPRRQGLI